MLNIVSSILAPQVPTPVNDYESIATFTLASATASVTFSSIAATYTHLQVRAILANSGGIGGYALQFNSDTGSNYAWHYLQGNGATTAAGATTSTTSITGALGTNTANVFGGSVLDILDYANTNKYKTARVLHGYDANGSGYAQINSGVWMNTAAINTIKLTSGNGNFAIYSSFALYGIKG